MVSPINTSTMPGDNMDPDAIEAAAGQIRTVGSRVDTTGGQVSAAWAGLRAGYHAPEQATLLGAMQPARSSAQNFSLDMGRVATALETFAGEVRSIKAAVARIRSDAAAFLTTIHDGQVTVEHHVVANRAQLEMGTSTTTSEDVRWDSDQASVDANNALIRRTNDQQEQLWAAERRCANAIRDIYHATHITAASSANPNGYGLTDIPDNAQGLPWGSTVERHESCGEKVVDGVVVDGLGGMAEGVTSLVGFSWSGPDGAGFSWSTAGNAWNGLGHLATGLNPISYPLAMLPGPVGGYFRDSVKTATAFAPGLVGIDLYAKDPFHKWKDNPARTFGSSLFNVGSFFVPGAGEAGAGAKGVSAGAKAAEGVDDAARASKAADAADAARAGHAGATAADVSRAVDGAGAAEVGNLTRAADLGAGVKGLDHVDIDIPRVSHDHISTDHANVGDHTVGDHHVGEHGAADAPPPRDPQPSAADQPAHSDSAPGHDQTAAHDQTAHHDQQGHTGDGTGSSGDGTKDSPRRYEYSNPAQPLSGAHEPSADALHHIGPSKDYAPGTAEHMTARWHEYHGNWSWDRWRDTYIRNQGHHARGEAYEQAFAQTRNLDDAEWSRHTPVKQLTGVDRNYDFVSTADREAYELKSGGSIDPRQLAKDEKLIRAGWDVHYVFGREPSVATIERLQQAGISYEVFYGDPVVVP